MTISIDLLGLAHPKFQIKAVLDAVPEGAVIGCFDDPFGDVIPKLRKLIEKLAPPAVRIHAHWSTAHAICPLPKLKKKLPTYEKLAQDYPGMGVYVSHSCEFNERSKFEIKARVDMVRLRAPSCIPVNSIYKGPIIPDVVTEYHGDIVVNAGEIVSMDGVDITDIKVKDWLRINKEALFRFGWRSSFNLREKGRPAPPPMQRTKGPTAREIAEVVNLLRR